MNEFEQKQYVGLGISIGQHDHVTKYWIVVTRQINNQYWKDTYFKHTTHLY